MAKKDGGKGAAQANNERAAQANNDAPKNDEAAATEPGTEAAASKGRDWSTTLFLPTTNFPMRAGLPENEPKLLARWNDMGLYDRLRQTSKGRDKFVLHDGPPYANGNIHIGHALNKILKDLVVKSQQMLGKDSNYVPGWDCHGLPIEWKIEQEYREKGRKKDEVPILELLATCRAFAQKWVDTQREEFKRLGVVGDWDKPYLTMAPAAEAVIARELLKFAANGLLYRGSKPVMWSVAEQTSLAEAEIEYHDYQSDMIWVKFPVVISAIRGKLRAVTRTSTKSQPCEQASRMRQVVVIWTTTPWTHPRQSSDQLLSTHRVRALRGRPKRPMKTGRRSATRYVLADKLAADVMKAAKVEELQTLADVTAND